MSTYRLDRLFSPRSVAVVGASPRITSAGRAVLRNLRATGFEGALHLVNPRHHEIDGIRSVNSVLDLPETPDLVVIAAPAQDVPGVVAAAGEKGAAAAIIITAGLCHGPGSLADACAKVARSKGLRLIGPNCIGVLAPHVRLNASFAASMPRAGDLALVSQSGAIVIGLVEWANARSVGFSAVVSLGDIVDVGTARGYQDDRRSNFARERDHARDVPRTRFRHCARSERPDVCIAKLAVSGMRRGKAELYANIRICLPARRVFGE